MTAAKAFVAFLVTFLGGAAERGVELPWWVEVSALALIATVAVWRVPNSPDPTKGHRI